MGSLQSFLQMPRAYQLLIAAVSSYFAYLIVLVVYRLYFSPLSHFPGSKLAAATGWYETYLDVFKGGQFIFQLEKWHQKYGVFNHVRYTKNPCLRKMTT